MKTVAEIRRANLEQLVVEFGSLDAVAALANASPIYLSQVRNQAIDVKTGKPRNMGNGIARRLEKGASKAEGWLDRDHGIQQDTERTTTPTTTGDAFLLEVDFYMARLREEFIELGNVRAARRGYVACVGVLNRLQLEQQLGPKVSQPLESEAPSAENASVATPQPPASR